MPATKVYGVRLGDQFVASNGDIMTVEKFITPRNMIEEWKAQVIINDSSTHVEVQVKDLRNSLRKYR